MTRWLVAILLMLSGVSMAKADALHQRRLAWHRCAPAKSGRFKAGLRDLNEGAFLLHLRAGGVRHQRRTRHPRAPANRHGIVGNSTSSEHQQPEPCWRRPHPVLRPGWQRRCLSCHLLAETLSDRLRQATQPGKSLAISGKARAALPMAGRLGEAWWFHERVGKFASGPVPQRISAWVKAQREIQTAPRQALGAAGASQGLRRSDEQPFESDWGAVEDLSAPAQRWLPRRAAILSALAASPMMNEVMVQFGCAGGEQLGRDDARSLS